MKKLLRAVDTLNEYAGLVTRWLCAVLVVILCIEVAMRYVFDSPTIWAHLSSMMIGGAIICLGLGYTHLHKSHIRIDVFYAKLSPRTQALIDVSLAILLLFPLLYAFTSTSYAWMMKSWLTQEVRTESFWYPLAGPFRTAVFVGWVLFALQCVAQFARDLYFLVRSKTL
ncbi:MAG: TRAP transporter small permease subunit [Dehalococcoidia bacterium]|nr:TRAP transporter small permease subunit [Dehalococcoidia bacterium]